jgi:MFS family permease
MNELDLRAMQQARLGLKENWRQFTLLAIINAFVGGMVGLERAILPQIAEAEFHLAAKTAIFSFIVVFGLVKALANYFTGALANRFGRKILLMLGWLFGIPVPFILMYAPNWSWIVAANLLLGINQGLAWSSTVVMKIDLVGENERGLAMGLNEFAGYLAVAGAAFLTGWIAANFGLRPYPFYLGVALSFAGFFASWLLVCDTRRHVAREAAVSNVPVLKNIFWSTTLFDRNLGSVTQAGLVNNLNDAMAWGLLPLVLAQRGFGIEEVGMIVAVYPAVWSFGQLFTGKMSDYFCKRSMLFWGMLLQGMALVLLIFASSFVHYIALSVVLGLGTAMVYPTFLATIAENTHPQDRAKSLGVFRLWRDLGYAVGALLTGIIADALGIDFSMMIIGALTIGSAVFIARRMRCRTNAVKLGEWVIKKFANYKEMAVKVQSTLSLATSCCGLSALGK